MSTRAQQFKAESLRSGKPSKRKRPKTPRAVSRADPADTAKKGISASDRKAGKAHTSERNRSRRAGKKAAFALEDSESARPSRKSSRRSKNRAKPDSNLRRRQTRKVGAAKTRARRAKTAKGKKR